MKKISVILCLLLTTAVLLTLTGCSSETKKINWDLHGAWITKDGETGEEVTFSLKGDFSIDRDQIGKSQLVELEIRWPENFVYIDQETQPYSAYAYHYDDSESIRLLCCGTSHEVASNRPVAKIITIDPEQEFVIITWTDGSNEVHLAASTNPDADPTEIYQHFQTTDPTITVDWTMHGSRVSPSGEVLETLEITVQGEIWQYNERLHALDLNFSFPEHFRYDLSTPVWENAPTKQEMFASASALYQQNGYHYSNSFSYDKVRNTMVVAEFAICTEQKYLIIQWNYGDYFLVASVDPNIDPQTVMDYFSVFDNENSESTIDGSAKNPQSVDWQLRGTWISADGTTHDPSTCSVSGIVQLSETGEDTLDLSITFAGGFSYQYESSTPYYSGSRKYMNLPYCVCPTYSYNRVTNDSVFSYIGISPEEEYIIFHWEDREGFYFVASTDPNTDPVEILTYFEEYVQIYTNSTK